MKLFVVRIAYRLWDRGSDRHVATAFAMIARDEEMALEIALSTLPDRDMVYAAFVLDHGEERVARVDYPNQVSRTEVDKDRWRILSNDIGGGY